MHTFSIRQGIEPDLPFQVESMDSNLRVDLWNFLILDSLSEPSSYSSTYDRVSVLQWSLWINYFRLPSDEHRSNRSMIPNMVKDHIMNAKWNHVYDLIEFIVRHHIEFDKPNDSDIQHRFSTGCNYMLKRNNAAYRLVEDQITPIVEDNEIDSIAKTFSLLASLHPARMHIKAALQLLSNREAPDYRNSVKESISAVEALCSRIANKPHASLGDALKELSKQGKVDLHGALRSALANLYGYTSDADGIRHALLRESNLDAEDALFMLVACSAFINYLIQKAGKAGITFS